MEYTQITPDQQYQIVEQKLRQYEQNHLVATVDLAASQAIEDTKQIAQLSLAVDQWAKAAAATQGILNGMPKPLVPTATLTGPERNAIRQATR